MKSKEPIKTFTFEEVKELFYKAIKGHTELLHALLDAYVLGYQRGYQRGKK